MRCILLIPLLLCCRSALCQQQASRLVGMVTVITQRDSTGNEFWYITDSTHYGYRDNGPVPVPVRRLGAQDVSGQYGLIKMYNPADGGPNYGLRSVMPARCDTVIQFTPDRRLHGMPAWGNPVYGPEPSQVTLNEYDHRNNLTALTIYDHLISCVYDPALFLWFRKTYQYDDRNNCTRSYDTSYSLLSAPRAIFQARSQVYTYDQNNNRTGEIDSILTNSQETGFVLSSTTVTHNTFYSTGRLAHHEITDANWRNGNSYPFSSVVDYSYSGNNATDSIITVSSDSRRAARVTYVCTYHYDNGLLMGINKGDSYEKLTYDAQGRLTKDEIPGKRSEQKWEWQYNDNGLPASCTSPQPMTDCIVLCPNGLPPVSMTITHKYLYQ